MDTAVVVHALEVRRGRLADRGEVDTRDEHVEAGELDRRPGGLLARPEAADARGHRLALAGRSGIGARAGASDDDGGRQHRRDPAHGECPPKRHPQSSLSVAPVEPSEWGLPIRSSMWDVAPHTRRGNL